MPGVRAVLITLLMPGVILLLVIDSWNDYRTLASITNEAYDSALLEPARVLESSVEFAPDGTLHVATPLYAQVMLESRAGLRKYFRIEEIDPPVEGGKGGAPPGPGRTLGGMPEMPRLPYWPKGDGEPLFFDAVYRNDPVRAVAVLRDLYYRGQHRQVLVVVAESIGKRQYAEESAQRQEILRDARMLALVAILVWWGVIWALRPLVRLRNDVRARRPDDLTPLDSSRVPSEVAPLVEAVNHHIARYRRILDEQSQFLADASHQLRTPLAIMLTQAQYALREPDPVRAQEGLRAIVDQLGRTRRLTEQLLSLAHASQAESTPRQRLDLNDAAREVVLQHLPLAHERQQDLGWVDARGDHPDASDDENDAVPVWGNQEELHEAVSNLVHNAIRYAPAGASITVSVVRDADRAEVIVSDNGPGIAPALRKRAFARFDRVGADRSSSVSGSGLGLSIARAYARRNDGDIVLRDGEPNAAGGCGLAAVLWMPLLKDAPSAPELANS
ncbi:sensor histidine kinase [Bordetella genomosp. 13]|uniref:histidine kinase n=1 Tax=Bordetella genomosp. 13 TaxID=463040 RepID=A0A1W6ZJL1_9BORD|nr:sensor histidine kinase [Bordetella genomosp. 13]ARP97566.1 sensor histidine kinase [Bordetella genomosp. 13]